MTIPDDEYGDAPADPDDPYVELLFPGRAEVARVPMGEWESFTAMAADLGMTVDEALRKAFRDGLAAEAARQARGSGPSSVRMDEEPRRIREGAEPQTKPEPPV